MIKTLKTLAITLLATGATVTGVYAAPVTDVSTNLFQPLTVTFSVYEQKAIAAGADTIETGAAASFKTADLLRSVETGLSGTDSQGRAFSTKSVLGYVTYETNTVSSNTTPILGTTLSNLTTNVVFLSTNVVPLNSVVSNYIVITNTITITNEYGATGTNAAPTNTLSGTNSTGLTNTGVVSANLATNTIVIGDSGVDTITIGTNGVVTVVTATSTNLYTNVPVTLDQNTAMVNGETLSIETNVALNGTPFPIDTNSVSIFTNSALFTNLAIGTNAVTISFTNGLVTNAAGTNSVTNALVVAVGSTSVTILTNSAAGTNFDTLETVSNGTTTVVTNTTTNSFTNVVAIGSDVLVSNNVTMGFGTNVTYLADTIDTTFTVVTNSVITNATTVTNSSTNYVINTTGPGGNTNVISTYNITNTTQVVVGTNIDIAAVTTNFATTNVTVTNGYNTTNVTAAPGGSVLVIEEPGVGTTPFVYTVVPSAILSITDVVTNEAETLTIPHNGLTTNESDYTIKSLTLNATTNADVSTLSSNIIYFKAQGLVHSTLDYVTVASSTLSGKKIAVTNEAWTFISGYGTNFVARSTGAPAGSVVLTGTAAVGTPAQEKQP